MDFIRDLKNLFKDGDDLFQEERRSPTPDPDVILCDLQALKCRYEEFLPKESKDAIDLLCINASHGCLR